MEYYVNSKTEEKTIYEIYKACRLCGAGAGYKMPIIQNVVNLATDEIELKQKIRECVQIEVHQDDKMPPLICELCVDKVNDFYEFMEMCKQTNKKTRLRLGLPPQTLPQGAPDAGDCILGVTEPVYINDDSNEAILTRNSKTLRNVKSKKELETKMDSKHRKEDTKPTKLSNMSPLRSGRHRQPSPPRLRGSKRPSDEEQLLSKLQKTKKPEIQPKSILKKVSTNDILEPRSKRSRGSQEAPKVEVQNKKVKISLNLSKKEKPESRPQRSAPTKLQYKCSKCNLAFKTPVALSNHVRTHRIQDRKRSPPPKLEPRVRGQTCSKCDRSLPLNQSKGHKCTSRAGPVCSKCNRKFLTPQALTSHEKSCKRVTGVSKIPRVLMDKIRPLQVRMRRCDSLLDGTRCRDATAVAHDFGLDKDRIYPYLKKSSRKLRIKSELAEYDSMVNIQDEIRDEFDLDECYVHWDSESEVGTDTEMESNKKNVKELSTLALKVIFSPKLLGKVPKKLRKIKSERPFESILQANELDCDMGLGIDSIINRLDDTNNSEIKNDDSLFNENKGPDVSNSDFDSIFNGTDCNKGDNDTTKTNTVKVDSSLAISENKNELCNKSDDSSKESIDDTDTSKLEVHSTTTEKINERKGADNDVYSNIESENDRISLVMESDSIVSDKCDKLYKEQEENKIMGKNVCESNEEYSKDSEEKEACNNRVITIYDENTFSDSIDTSREAKETCSENERDAIETSKNSADNSEDSDVRENQGESKTVASKEKEDIINRETDKAVATNLILKPSAKIDSSQENQIQDAKPNSEFYINNGQSDCEPNVNQQFDHKTKESVSETEEMIVNDDKSLEVKLNGDSLTDKVNKDNLEDISDTDMDDSKLMEELDAQIGESDASTDATEGTLDLRENKQTEHHSTNV